MLPTGTDSSHAARRRLLAPSALVDHCSDCFDWTERGLASSQPPPPPRHQNRPQSSLWLFSEWPGPGSPVPGKTFWYSGIRRRAVPFSPEEHIAPPHRVGGERWPWQKREVYLERKLLHFHRTPKRRGVPPNAVACNATGHDDALIDQSTIVVEPRKSNTTQKATAAFANLDRLLNELRKTDVPSASRNRRVSSR